MELLSVKDLNLVFRLDLLPQWTWRDLFIQSLKNPIDAILPKTNQLHLLQNISFSINQGERVGILGVNGTGKTSLCRCIAGIYRQTSGVITASGKVRAVFDTGIGIYPELSGRENAQLLACLLYPDDLASHADLVEEALQFSELGDFADVPFKLYSNGMQARLCLSLISSRPADILILDEVFDGADVFFRQKVSERIVNLIETSGAVLFVSHSSEQIIKTCNRVLVISQGQIVFDGNVLKGIEHYMTLNPKRQDLP